MSNQFSQKKNKTESFSRRGFLGRTSMGALAALFPFRVKANQGGRQPNVIIILTDDQGTLDANCFGSSDLYTPAIDELAANGMRFTQAYAHSVCCPARAMLLTGRYPQRSNVNSWMQGKLYGPKGRNMLQSEVTLAETLQSAGYKTGLFGKWHLGAHPDHGPTMQGFDEFFGNRNGFIDNYNHYQLHREGFHDLYQGTTKVFHRGSYFPDMITDRALSFIEKNQDRPFFLYYSLNIPHYPEQALKRHQKRYEHLSEPRRSYAAMVSTTDDYMGRILTQLKVLDLFDDTIVVFMSDNGYSAEDYQITVDHHLSGYARGHNYGANGGGGNTGKWIGSKGSFLEGGIRVPAILSYPRAIEKGSVRNQPITAMDWYPTILQLANISKPTGVQFDGFNILPLVKNKNHSSQYSVMHWQWQDGWAVRQGEWKLIYNGTLGINRAPLDKIHLANLNDKQPEKKNHANERPDIVKKLDQIHQQWIDEVTPENLPDFQESPP